MLNWGRFMQEKEKEEQEVDLEEARNLFAFLQVPGMLKALKVIYEAGERGASFSEVVEKAELLGSYESSVQSFVLARPNIERLIYIGLVVSAESGPNIEKLIINPAISLTGERILHALFSPAPQEPINAK